MSKATFVDIGALWIKKGGKSKASGSLDLDALEDLLRADELKNEKKVRCFISEVESSHERAPDYRLTAVFGGDDDGGSRRSRGRRNDKTERVRNEGRERRSKKDDEDEEYDDDIPF